VPKKKFAGSLKEESSMKISCESFFRRLKRISSAQDGCGEKSKQFRIPMVIKNLAMFLKLLCDVSVP
jgi:hypothetical protein